MEYEVVGAVGIVLFVVEGDEGTGGFGTLGVLRLRCAPLRMTDLLREGTEKEARMAWGWEREAEGLSPDSSCSS